MRSDIVHNVVFVTGGPGRGKTALLAEFGRRAMEANGLDPLKDQLTL